MNFDAYVVMIWLAPGGLFKLTSGSFWQVSSLSEYLFSDKTKCSRFILYFLFLPQPWNQLLLQWILVENGIYKLKS